MKQTKSKGISPIYNDRVGNISLSRFVNQRTADGKKFKISNFVIQKGYKDKDGEWQRMSVSLSNLEMQAVKTLISKLRAS